MMRIRTFRLNDSLYMRIKDADPTGLRRFSTGLMYIIKFFFDQKGIK